MTRVIIEEHIYSNKFTSSEIKGNPTLLWNESCTYTLCDAGLLRHHTLKQNLAILTVFSDILTPCCVLTLTLTKNKGGLKPRKRKLHISFEHLNQCSRQKKYGIHILVQYFLYLETNRQPLHVTQWMISDPSVLSSLLIHHVQCLENVRLIIFMTKSNYQDVGTRATPHFVGTQKRIRIHPGYASNGCRGRRKKKRSLISL